MIADLAWWLFAKLKGYVQYNLVGVVGMVINFAVLYLLTEMGHLWYFFSATIGIVLAATGNFVLNYLWTFKDRKRNITNIYLGWLKFLLSIVLVEGIYLGLVYGFTSKMGLYYMFSAFLSLCLTSVIRYIVADKWVWRRDKSVEVKMMSLKLEDMINEKVYKRS